MTHPERNKYHRDAMQAVEYGDGDFYVYIHFRNDTGEPFYVGKGMKNGYYDRVKIKDRSHNPYWQNIVNKHGYTAKVIRNCGSDEELSHDYETELIALFRGIGFELTNLTNGGEGMSGHVPSEETRRKLSESKSGENHPFWGKTFSDEHRHNMSMSRSGENNYLFGNGYLITGENNPFWGRTHSEETKRKMSESKSGENHPFWGKNHSEESIQKMSGCNNWNFVGFSIGFNDSKIILFSGGNDMKSRGFDQGNISRCINKNPKVKTVKGYSFIRTLDKSDIIKLLETRIFADNESEAHFNNW